MKIARAVIENFRQISSLEIDFRDSLGRVRDVTLLVGPNGSGKTTVLDALSVGVGLISELPYARPGFELTPRHIVQRGALTARVTCEVQFSPEEVDVIRNVFALTSPGEENRVPNVSNVTIVWTYPAPDRKKYPWGYAQCQPREAWRLFKGRVQIARLLSTGRVDWTWFKGAGGVFTFDQQRTGMGKVIPRDIWQIIQGEEVNGKPDDRRTADPRTILVALGVQSLIKSESQTNSNEFVEIQRRYAELCAPHQIKEVVRDELGELDIIFADGIHDYSYSGLSSGEEMILLFLIRMVTERIHHSVVLIDELELHQHPLWQRKLLYLLPRMGHSNQIIATSHSPYLRDALPPDSVVMLGELDEDSARAAGHKESRG